MKYYLIYDTFITEYNTLEELDGDAAYFINDDDNWYIIKGEILKDNRK